MFVLYNWSIGIKAAPVIRIERSFQLSKGAIAVGKRSGV